MDALSVLDLAFVVQDATPADALRNMLDLAQHAERWGYRRYWLAEHHNMVGNRQCRDCLCHRVCSCRHAHASGNRRASMK
jgi:alkanesulfonate monooxygenase SsuD/methylene tetrahydromethanopterin reductase-like flavin-dependent oxidoreductase (luciferase family)